VIALGQRKQEEFQMVLEKGQEQSVSSGWFCFVPFSHLKFFLKKKSRI
jgi:hypothetical protein